MTVTETRSIAMGRRPLGKKAMTAAERQRRHRAGQAESRRGQPLTAEEIRELLLRLQRQLDIVDADIAERSARRRKGGGQATKPAATKAAEPATTPRAESDRRDEEIVRRKAADEKLGGARRSAPDLWATFWKRMAAEWLRSTKKQREEFVEYLRTQMKA